MGCRIQIIQGLASTSHPHILKIKAPEMLSLSNLLRYNKIMKRSEDSTQLQGPTHLTPTDNG